MKIFLLFISFSTSAELVSYVFDIHTKNITVAGKTTEALAIQDQIPAPLISAKVGDTLQVTFRNKMSKETSIHWHGVLLPNDQDGVTYLTTDPILPYSSFTYKFLVKHEGTYWYHSHTGLQEQRGLYGPLVFYPKNNRRRFVEKTIVLSDWTHENPNTVLANLKKDGDWYALKKGKVISWWGILQQGFPAVKHRFFQSLMRMGPMDISDVGYDAFLMNGKENDVWPISGNRFVKLRVINAAASSYFYLQFADQKMKVIAADGNKVQPYEVETLRLAIGETYDVLVPTKTGRAYELRATSEDVTGSSSLFIGKGKKIFAKDIVEPNLYLPQKPNEEWGYKKIKSTKKIKYQGKIRTVHLNLTGSMRNYVWSFNNKTLKESDKILIKKGEVVRFILNNKTMMHHPLHLHGHFFRVLNKHGDWSPLKHTVSVPAHGRVEIEFLASEEKDWFFHCHNLYHMKTGMSRVISYEETQKDINFSQLFKDPFYFFTEVKLGTHLLDLESKIFSTRHKFNFEIKTDYKTYDLEFLYIRNISNLFNLYGGWKKESIKPFQPILGFKWTLPFLIDLDVQYMLVDRQFSVEVESELQLSDQVRFEWEWELLDEYEFRLTYNFYKKFSLGLSYHSQFGKGIDLSWYF